MPAPRKIFRIEQMSLEGAGDSVADWAAPSEPVPTMASPAPSPAARPVPMHASIAIATADDEAARRHHELIAEIKALRTLVEPKEDAQRILDTYQAQLSEMQRLKGELVIIHNAIIRTKQEIATLHVTGGFQGQNMSRMTHELDAVVNGTEQATQTILNMVEDIDQFAATMIEQGKDDAEKQMGHEIQDRVVKVFEACNFQDITGQRISKVVNTWKFIESHVVQMMEIWGGIDAFKEFIPEEPPKPQGDDALLNGPKLEEDVGHASQDDIDALFP
jgi:chemotaxis protein CheZ